MTAAYNWTYPDIDVLTLGEANDLFLGWKDNPPTNLLLQAIINGFAGRPSRTLVDAPSAVDAIPTELKNKPGIAVVKGRDIGVPTTVLDIEGMRLKNAERIKARLKRG